MEASTSSQESIGHTCYAASDCTRVELSALHSLVIFVFRKLWRYLLLSQCFVRLGHVLGDEPRRCP